MSAGELKFDRELFLAEYWQRKPLLIRNAITGFQTPLPADELAGLALEDAIESRIIECRDDEWRLCHGPFEPEDFERDHPWTLLVQAVDHYIPAVAELRQLVSFLPLWRVDDVMVSYAADGGSVGPHYDNYDVFLLQGEGVRRWQLGQRCDANSPLIAHDELRILQQFECREEHVLGPGDILYVPPGLAHWGVAQGECTTFSIGFRAPRINDLVSRWADRVLEQLDPELFYTDSAIEAAPRAGEIRPQDLARVRAQLRAALERESSDDWFGAMVTEPRYSCEPLPAELDEARALLAGGASRVLLSTAARVAWQDTPEGILVFCNGEGLACAASVKPSLITLCEQWRLEGDELSEGLAREDTASMLDYLLENGGIHVE
ncbi:MAG: cupin domain-containing protein [Halioglobus sp.]|nr:cupin domain-containing protein [Halioglobus sp.]